MGAIYKHAKPLPESVTLSQIIQSIPKEVCTATQMNILGSFKV